MPRTMLETYQLLLEINLGYEQVIHGLEALRTHAAFDRGELNRFRALPKQWRQGPSQSGG